MIDIYRARKYQENDFLTGVNQEKEIPRSLRFTGAEYDTYTAYKYVLSQNSRPDDTFESIYLAPKSDFQSGPAIIVFHNRHGIMKELLEMQLDLVARGYRVLVVDLFNADPEKEGDAEILEELFIDTPISKLTFLLDLASAHLRDSLGATWIGLLGYDMGAFWVNRLAKFNTPPAKCEEEEETPGDVPKSKHCNLCAIVSFYGAAHFLKSQAKYINTPFTAYLIAEQEDLSEQKIQGLKKAFSKKPTASIMQIPNQSIGFLERYRKDRFDQVSAEKLWSTR